MKSKFKFWAYFLGLLSTGFSTLIVSLILSDKALNPKTPLLFILLFSAFMLFVWIWLVFGEMRTKAIQIHFGYDSLEIRGYLGLGPSKTFYYNDVQGYKISILPSRSGSYEYLYLIINNKKVVKLSEYYHSNYEELKAFIASEKFKNLGFENFSYIRELKEIFETYN